MATGKKVGGGTMHKSLIWGAWLLSTAGFAILLAGVASMQSACGDATPQLQGTGGTTGYLTPNSCNKFFRYTWWITALHFLTWLLVAACLAAGIVHKSRTALVGLLAVAAVLLMDTANTYLYYNDLPNLTGKMDHRTKLAVAGAIIAAVADLLLILLIGWHDEKSIYGEHIVKHEYDTGVYPAAATITGTSGTTTTTSIDRAVPVAYNV